MQDKLTIVSQNNIAPYIYEMELKGKLVNEMKLPGQFINIKIPSADKLLRRPISIHEIIPTKETCKIIYRIEGEGTQILSKLPSGFQLDILGPLGNGFNTNLVNSGDSVLIVGGGIGTPPMYQLAKVLNEKGANLSIVLGYAKKEVMFHLDKFSSLGNVYISTDDGSFGQKGHVGLIIDELLKTKQFDAVFACGAKGLLLAVDEKFKNHPNAFISTEARMACGIGACYGCVSHLQNDETHTKSVKVCDQGPIFETGKVVI